MYMWTKFTVLAVVAGALCAQTPLDPRIEFAADSPLTVVSSNWDESKTTARGGAMVIDLKSSIVLKNTQNKRIRAVTLLVLAQDATPGGKGSITLPSLDIGPKENFPVKIDMRLLRPLDGNGASQVRVRLDGVLFDDLSFLGDNRLNCRRSMLLWEMEARRDRKYFKSVLEAKGLDGLQKEVLTSLEHQAQRPKVDVQMGRGLVGMPATAAAENRQVQFSFLRMPDAPIDIMAGSAKVAANAAHLPEFTVRNKSSRAIRFMDIGWIIKDSSGREFLAGSLPADVMLSPGGSGHIDQKSSLKFSNGGSPVTIQGMTGFVNHVEYADGEVWIPSRTSLEDPRIARVAAPSPEEQRLTEIYRRKGAKALADELKKF